MILRFANGREMSPLVEGDSAQVAYVTALNMGRPEGKTLEARTLDQLAPDERAQLVAMATAGYPELATLDAEQLWDEELRRTTKLGEIAEYLDAATIEWWDVLDETDRLTHRVWLFAGDAGKVFPGTGAKYVGLISQLNVEIPDPTCDFLKRDAEWVVPADDAPALRAALDAAVKDLAKRHPGAQCAALGVFLD